MFVPSGGAEYCMDSHVLFLSHVCLSCVQCCMHYTVFCVCVCVSPNLINKPSSSFTTALETHPRLPLSCKYLDFRGILLRLSAFSTNAPVPCRLCQILSCHVLGKMAPFLSDIFCECPPSWASDEKVILNV